MKNNKTSIITPFQIAKKVDFGLIKNEQNKFDIHTNILANFSKPFKSNIKDSYHLFTNVYFFDYDILDIDPNVLIERTSRILGYQKYFLIIVYPEYGEIKTETIYSNHHPNCEIVVMHTSFEDLFKSGLMNKIYLENDNSTLAYRTVMIFRGWTYSGLQTVFRIQNIILSGGASQKRHILNPSVHRFSQFISAFESCNLNGVITSFHNVQPLEMESGSFIKGALGPKSYKDKNAIGDISTKAFDIRWRALFKKYFDTELPIRGNKHLVSAKRIGTNVSANTQNNDSLVTNENAQISQISINLQRDSKNEIDFDNDPWIDDSLKSNLYNTLSASEKALIDNKVKQSVESWKQRLLAENIKQNEDRNNKLEQLKIEAKQIEALELNEKQRKLEMKINEEQTKAQGKKIETKILGIIKHLIALDGLGNKKSYKQNLSHITKSKLEAKKDELLKATSDKDSELNIVFPQIFKSYLNKPFGAFKSITKTNVLEFKKLLLNEHPTLVKIRAKELEYKNQIEQNKLIAKANNESAENVRIKNWKLVYPGISINEIPKFATVDLLSLEQALLLKEQEIKAKEAEQIRKASILSKDELKAKKIKELEDLLNNSKLADFERDELERELKRLTINKSKSNEKSKPSNSKRGYSTSSRSIKTFEHKRNYHTSSIRLDSNKNEGGKAVLELLTEHELNKEINNSVVSIDNKQHLKLFTFLDYVYNVLNDETLTTYEKQTKIETEWMDNIKIKLLDPEFSKTRLSLYITRAFNILKIQLSGKKPSKTSSIKILSDDFNTFLIRIESLILAFGYIITYCSRMNYTYIASLIGNAIFWEYFRFYNKNVGTKAAVNPKMKNVYNYDLFYSDNNFDEEQAVRLGDLLIECFIRIEIIDRRFDLEDKGKAYIEIRQDCINEIVENTFIVPTSLPMCHKPNEWSDDKRGGFLSNLNGKGKGEDLIQGSALREKHLIENKQELFDSINYLDSIKFKINKDFLEFILNDGYYLLSLEDEKNWTQNLISIKIAKTFINTPFYINTFADWRGRIYTNSFFISYQGSNLAKNLIYFNEGEVLNEKGFDYLYIYGANAYNENGLAKKSINERINWVQMNYQKILKMDKEFLINAKEKFTFAAFCLVIRKLHQNHKAIIHLPIFLDATCSGIQHLAALMKDLDSASRVNLIEQNRDEPVGDIYSDVVGPVNEALNKFGLDNMQTHSHFTKIKLTRKEIKPLVMTKPYNASIFGMTQQLATSFELTDKAKELLRNKLTLKNKVNIDFNDQANSNSLVKKDENEIYNPYIFIAPAHNGETVLLSKKDLYLIAKIVDNQVFMMFPALKKIYDYLLDISKVLRDLNIPITWFTPSGIKITQLYLKNETHNYYMRSGNTRKTIILRNKMKDANSNEYVVDRRKQVESIIPNVIHSLDAAHLMFVIKECINSNILPIITVHDCFGTLPNQMFFLEQVVKKQFIYLYSKENFLLKFHKKLLDSIEDNNYIIFKKGERKGRKDKIIELLRTFDNANIKRKSSNLTGKITKKSTLTKEEQILNLSIKITKSLKNNNALVVFIDDLKFQKFPNSTTTKIESVYSFLEVPSLPALGKLDLTKIINSKYMIT